MTHPQDVREMVARLERGLNAWAKYSGAVIFPGDADIRVGDIRGVLAALRAHWGMAKCFECGSEITRICLACNPMDKREGWRPDLFWDADDPEDCAAGSIAEQVERMMDYGSVEDEACILAVQPAVTLPTIWVKAIWRKDEDLLFTEHKTQAEAEAAPLPAPPADEVK